MSNNTDTLHLPDVHDPRSLRFLPPADVARVRAENPGIRALDANIDRHRLAALDASIRASDHLRLGQFEDAADEFAVARAAAKRAAAEADRQDWLIREAICDDLACYFGIDRLDPDWADQPGVAIDSGWGREACEADAIAAHADEENDRRADEAFAAPF